jgi:tRNA (uracil-5-)-methyltransferase TRM9
MEYMGNSSDQERFQKSKMVWEENLKLFPNSKLQFPAENLVRLFSGRYVSLPPGPAKIMDHGFGHGNSLVYFSSLGYECSGCEISEHLVNEVSTMFEQSGTSVDLKLIEGLNLPFEDDSFDIVVSWDVLHYNGTREAVTKTIDELHRVLKPGGILLLSSIHPDFGIMDRMTPLGDDSYLIEKDSSHDNRQGLTFFCTESEKHLAKMFGQFSEVKSGKVYFDLFDHAERYASSLIYAVK